MAKLVDNLTFLNFYYMIILVIIMEKIYKREDYLKKIRTFYNDYDLIKVITGIRRCGKSFFLKSIIEELKELGIKDKDIIYLELDKKEYKDIDTPSKLEKLIDEKITDQDFKYLFIDEIQNVVGFEPLINSYREEKNMSIFITGSNSYLLSGELVTKLTGRYIEIEMMTLSFYEYVDMKRFLGKEVNENIYMNGKEVYKYAVTKTVENIKELLEKSKLTLEDIKYIIPHQSNLRILASMAEKIGASSEQMLIRISSIGNIFNASIPIVLNEVLDKSLLQENDKIILVGYGGGLNLGSILIET